MTIPVEIQAHIAEVERWLDDNVRVVPAPRAVTLSDFEIDWSKLTGSFTLALDGEPLPDRFRFDLEITGWLRWQMPMFHSPLGAPASYAAYEFTPETRRAIDEALRAVLPRLHGCGLVRATGQRIDQSTPLEARIVDWGAFEAAKARASASGFVVSARVGVNDVPRPAEC